MSDNLFYRHFELNRESVKEDERSIDLSISSEAPVERWFGPEVILHGKDNIDFSRLNSALLNHNPDKIIGRVTDARIERKKAKAKIIFDNDDLGDQAFSKVQSGSLKGVSIGYVIEEFRELQKEEKWRGFEGPMYIATKTSIYEASLTPIPADPTVGIGRDLTRSLDGINIIKTQTNNREAQDMDSTEVTKMIEAERTRYAGEIEGMVEKITIKVTEQLREEAAPKFQVSPAEYSELMGRAAAIDDAAKIKVADMVGEGKRVTEITSELLTLATGKRDATDTGDGPGGNGTGIDENDNSGPPAEIRSFKQVTDEDFLAGLSNPATFAIN